MELENAAPRRVPLLVQEDDQVKSAMPLSCGVVVEVNVIVEFSTGQVFVGAASHVLGVVEEERNARDSTDEVEERLRLNDRVEFTVGASEFPDFGVYGLAVDRPVVVAGVLGLERGKVGSELLKELDAQHVLHLLTLKDHVRKGLGLAKGGVQSMNVGLWQSRRLNPADNSLFIHLSAPLLS